MTSAVARPPDRLVSERLHCRPWHLDDADALQDALTESVEHLLPWIPWATPRAPTGDETRARIQLWIADFAAGTNFLYAALRRDNGRLVGGVGLYGRVGPGALEIGYWLRRTEVGSGFATEASDALTSAGLAVPGIERIEIRCSPDNQASRHIPEKLGYRLLRIEDGERATAVYELRRDQPPTT